MKPRMAYLMTALALGLLAALGGPLATTNATAGERGGGETRDGGDDRPDRADAEKRPAPRPQQPLVLAADALRLHSLGVDRWDVWTCGEVGGTAAEAAARLNAEVAPYFAWLSDGRYQQRFRARGALDSDGDDLSACGSEAARESAGREGALIVQNERISAGADECAADLTTLDPCAGRATLLPESERIAWLGPAQLFGEDAHLSTVVHELGHTLNWPHSFTGRLRIEHEGAEVGIEYDDPFDVMGYERLWGSGSWTDPTIGSFTPKATQAFNRIVSGWVPADAVAVHDRRRATYTLAPLDRDGLGVLVVPTADRRAFLTLETRVRRPRDPVPGDGVVVHAIDQRPAACSDEPQTRGCWGDQLRSSPAPNRPDSLESLVTVGERVEVAGVEIAVRARRGDRFTVTVDGERARFAPLKPTLCLLVPDACEGGIQGPLRTTGAAAR